MSKVTLCIPTLTRFDSLEVCVQSALAGTRPPNDIAIMDNSCGKLADISWIDAIDNITVFFPPENMGVAPSWNFFMEQYADIVILSNDDVTFKTDTLELLIAAIEDGGYGLYMGSDIGKNGFSLFSVPQVVYKHVGRFDEEFAPAYYEDNDYHRRLKKNRFETLEVPNVFYDHVGSATVNSYTPEEYEQHRLNFIKNQNYYTAKWGGLPGLEVYDIPFNGATPQNVS